MATILRQALAQQDPPQWVDPYAAQIKALQEQLAQPQGPMYTPEQVAQRRAENQRQYELGLLGQLSGDDSLQAVGGQVLRQALANRQQRVSERGTTDPITGAFTYSPEFLQAQKEQQLAGLQQRSAAAQGQFQENRQKALERSMEAQQRAQDRMELRAMMAANGAANRQSAQDSRMWQAEDRLADDYRAETKTASQVQNGFRQLQALSQRVNPKTGQMDPNSQIAFVYSFMKMLDPGSVVREGEFATAQNAAGVPDQIRNQWNKMLRGEFLNPQQVQQMLGAAGNLNAQAERSIAGTQADYTDRARRRGLNAESIVGSPVGAGGRRGVSDPLGLR